MIAPEAEADHVCFMCEQALPAVHFSNRQITKGGKRKCHSCINVYARIPAVVNALYHHECAYCRGSGADSGWLTREHLIPLSHSTLGNRYQVRLACVRCNAERGDNMQYEPFVRLMATTPDLRRKVYKVKHADCTTTSSVHNAVNYILRCDVVNNKQAVVECLRQLIGTRVQPQ